MRILPSLSIKITPQMLIRAVFGRPLGRPATRRPAPRPSKSPPKSKSKTSAAPAAPAKPAPPMKRGPEPVQTSWAALVIPPTEAPRRDQFEAVLDQRVAGILMNNVVAPDACRRACEALGRQTAKGYEGIATNLGAGVGHSHWGPRYPEGNSPEAWRAYFDAVEEWDRLRKKLLEPIFGCDPLDIVVGILRGTYGPNVRRAVHPRFGRPMGAGLIRTGSAKPHLDNANFDIPLESTGHLGIVLVLNGSDGAIQRAYKATLVAPTTDGNYDLPVPAGTEYVDVPSPTGSFNVLAAPLIHEVIDEPDRTTLSLHVARTKSGGLVYYS